MKVFRVSMICHWSLWRTKRRWAEAHTEYGHRGWWECPYWRAGFCPGSAKRAKSAKSAKPAE